MAQHLARIHGTEEDKVNCPFYYKIGVCRHGDRCSRLHHKPAFSQTLLIKHIFQHPVRQAELHNTNDSTAAAGAGGGTNGGAAASPEQQQEDFLCFFEDMYTEFSKFGHVEELHVIDNLADHMIGHLYVKFQDEEQASDAMSVMQGRYYDGRPLQLEFSPVTDFMEARCRDYDEDTCSRGGFCNFLHAKPVPRALLRSLQEDCERDRRRHEEQQQSSNNTRSSSDSKHHHHHHHRRSSSKKRRKESRSSSSRRSSSSKRSRHEESDRRSSRDRDRDRQHSSDDDDDRSYSSKSPE